MPIVNLNSSIVVKAMVLKVGFLQPSVVSVSTCENRDRIFVLLFGTSESLLSRVTTAGWRAEENKHFSDWDDLLWSREF